MIRRIKNLYHLLVAFLANIINFFPSRKLYIIGVTGTNGKTTTVQMIGKILENAGNKVGINSTINFWIDDKKWINDTKFTTTNALYFQNFLKECADAGCKYVIAEISSHALDQNRVWGTKFDMAVITNVTREHLDYHKNMEKYRKTKTKLFKMTAKNKKTGFSIVNLNMKNPKDFFVGDENKIYGYAIKKPSIKKLDKKHIIKAEKLNKLKKGTSFVVDKTRYSTPLPGKFNVENALAAITVAKILKIKKATVKQTLRTLKRIPGRMDPVPNKLGIEIIIDYALTPDSMEKVGRLFHSKLKRRKNKKLIWIFGSCGERDKGKRPIMGNIVSKYADYAIVTNEDPYGENPKQIINQIFQGINKKNLIKAYRILDRKKAIKKGLNIAKKGDVILITGKGAEQNMKIGKYLIKWNDKEVTQELIKEYFS
ncbi:MAG: UDP-N-acetylmuramoyl-L-alanyl-D-glutamate--2,6-diaminopimelate ligase [Candidatus Moranbacteria bacterium]|nr:UDP-N-acetylmuramoyl-L-alanyl-D-glutamate--2,6-diaminopimelate ligase [Candidatus Moranbacteria bacterium]